MRNSYRRAATKLGRIWGLSRVESDRLFLSPCHYCGAEPSLPFRDHGKLRLRNGIDRVANSQGYVSGNVVPCCTLCNRAKSSLPVATFVDWAVRVAKHSGAWATSSTQLPESLPN